MSQGFQVMCGESRAQQGVISYHNRGYATSNEITFAHIGTKQYIWTNEPMIACTVMRLESISELTQYNSSLTTCTLQDFKIETCRLFEKSCGVF